jgi:hypothetical protein
MTLMISPRRRCWRAGWRALAAPRCHRTSVLGRGGVLPGVGLMLLLVAVAVAGVLSSAIATRRLGADARRVEGGVKASVTQRSCI